jgi:hypothetical protein
LLRDEDCGPRAATADRIDLDDLVARIGCPYGPPFQLRNFACSWINDGIAPEHSLAVVDRHLKEHAASCQSGSGEHLLPYLNKLLRFEWSRTLDTGRADSSDVKRLQTRPGNSLDEFTPRSGAKRLTEADWLGSAYAARVRGEADTVMPWRHRG